MSFTNQEFLSVRHYSQLKPITCTIVSGNIESFFTVKMVDPVKLNDNLVKGDPIIFGAFSGSDDVTINGGSVIAFVESEGNIVITPDKVFAGSERRQYERFPVSLFCNITNHGFGTSKKRSHGYIKDMSYSGFRVYSDADLSQGDTIDVDIFLHNNMLSISGTVMRKSVFYGRNEYGIQIVFRDKGAIYSTQDFMDKLMVHEKDLLKKQLIKNTIHLVK